MTEDKAVLSMNVDIEEAGPVYQILFFLIAGESTLMPLTADVRFTGESLDLQLAWLMNHSHKLSVPVDLAELEILHTLSTFNNLLNFFQPLQEKLNKLTKLDH